MLASDSTSRADDQLAPRVASVQITMQPAGQSASQTLTAPRLTFNPGQKAQIKADAVKLGDKTLGIEINLETLAETLVNEQPLQHVVEIRLTELHGAGKPIWLASPKITVFDGQPAHLALVELDGQTLSVDALIVPAK
jgi:hypothetical protein